SLLFLRAAFCRPLPSRPCLTGRNACAPVPLTQPGTSVTGGILFKRLRRQGGQGSRRGNENHLSVSSAFSCSHFCNRICRSVIREKQEGTEKAEVVNAAHLAFSPQSPSAWLCDIGRASGRAGIHFIHVRKASRLVFG